MKYEKLIFKLLTHNISEKEILELENWVKLEGNSKILEDYIKLNYATNSMLHDFNALKSYHSAVLKTKKVRKLKNTFFKYAAAASVLLIVTLTVFLNKDEEASQFTEPIIVNNQIETGTDKATLTLEDGTDIALVKGQTYQTQNATSNGEEIIYLPVRQAGNNSTSRELVNNYLTTARGEQFQITLADGTQVWLNSETQLKYPVSFTDGESRQVELVYGEAYFDVSPSTNHEGSKFKVYNNNQEVEVLGTEFNIRAYKDENNVYTTLVEGKVAVTAGSNIETLVPSQQSDLDVLANTMNVETIEVYDVISWKDGIFSFEGKPLKDIMKTLSRWYDLDVVFANEELEGILFVGSLNKEQDIIHVLNDIKNFGVIKNYEINNKTITLK